MSVHGSGIKKYPWIIGGVITAGLCRNTRKKSWGAGQVLDTADAPALPGYSLPLLDIQGRTLLATAFDKFQEFESIFSVL